MGIQPSEFWNMTVPEFHLLAEAKKPRDPKSASIISEDDVAEFQEWFDEDERLNRASS